MKKIYCKILIISVFVLSSSLSYAQNKSSDIVFQIGVVPDFQNNSINLEWNKLPNVSGYKIYRKVKGGSAFNFVTNKSVNDTTFVDANVPVGVAYEYAVYASHTNDISGYVCAGLNIDVTHQRGNVLLMIDSNYITAAQNEIEIFKIDLIKDGWKVLVQYAGRNETPQVVKQRISSCHGSSALEGVILLGNIPVPYSGDIAPDTHSDHIGAWPADVYYSDMCSNSNNIWHDASLVNTSAVNTRNHNIVGDGKFDVSVATNNSSTKIFVGRIDVSDMSTINSDDVVLFKQYIQKNHAYRASVNKFKEQGLIDDNFGYFYGEAFAQNGWRNMSALLGADKITEGDYMTDMKNDSYLWSYACGGGWNTGATGVGTTTSFKSNQIQSVFTMLYGSYFGDWDEENNFLRAPIASPSSTLVSFWAGRPNWFLHTMAMGDPIGYSYLNTVNNTGNYFPEGFANAQVHQSIQGDPTLHMYVYEAPTNLQAFEVNNGHSVKLEWSFSVDTSVVGYYVYRASNINGDFQLLNQTPVSSAEFTDTNPLPSASNLSSTTYMVRAVKLEETVTGTFYNLSPGDITEGFSSNAPLAVTVTEFSGIENETSNLLQWDVVEEENIKGYEIEKSEDLNSYEVIGEQAALADEGGIYNYEFTDSKPTENNYYRLKIIDAHNDFTYHSKIVRIQRATIEQTEVVSLFPNPTKNDINLLIPTAENNDFIKLTVFDMKGRAVLNQSFVHSKGESLKLNVSRLVPGHYFVQYYNEESRIKKHLRFVKSN